MAASLSRTDGTAIGRTSLTGCTTSELVVSSPIVGPVYVSNDTIIVRSLLGVSSIAVSHPHVIE